MVTTINPADCDRTTVYTGECRNFADTEWIRFDSGRRRSPDASDGNTWLIDVAFGSFWMADDKVRNLVPLVPGRDFSGVDWKAMYDQARRERDEWEKALHQARASVHEACKVAQSYKVDAYQATERAEAAERERDEWKARAEAAERERDEAQGRADRLRDERDDAVQSCITVGRARDEWKARAEAADARTAPAVTRDEISRAILGQWGGSFDAIRDAAYALVSGDDPAVFVVRESDVAAVEVGRNEERDWWTRNRGYGEGSTAEGMRQVARIFVEDAADCEAIARAIEAEQATDPVTEKARELYALAHPGVFVPKGDDAELVPFRRIAAHVLGQEES